MKTGDDNQATDGILQLLQITDPHLTESVGQAKRGVDTYRSLQDVLERASGLHGSPDGILATGDLVHDESRKGYENFRELLGRFVSQSGATVFTLPGNHDDPQLMQETLSKKPFQYCGHKDFPGWRLIFLDTWLEVDAGGLLRDSELTRLDELLTTASDRHALLCLHHQPVSMGSRWLDSVGLRNADQFLQVVDRHANVRGVVWGHVHQEFDSIRKGVRYLSSPSTCAQFKPRSDDFALDDRPPGFRCLELAGDGTINTSIEWLDVPAAEAVSQ
jgi:Icc protein